MCTRTSQTTTTRKAEFVTDTQRRTPDEVLDQIVEILNLANNSAATPEEAANAAAIAQRLMFRYNIAEARVRQRTDQVNLTNGIPDPTVGFHNVGFDIGAKTNWISVWRRSLLHGIATANWCRALHYSGTSRMTIVGREENITTVKHLYEYLVAEVWRLCKIAFKADPYSTYASQSESRSWQKSFCQGAVYTVCARLGKARREAERESAAEQADTNALVVIEERALAAAFDSFHPEVRAGRQTQISNGGAFRQGQRAGNQISLNRQVRG